MMRAMIVGLTILGLSGVGSVSQGGLIVADPDSFASGTLLNTAFPGLTLSRVGSSTLVEANVYAAAPMNASTGTLGFSPKQTDGTLLPDSWNDPDIILRADFTFLTEFVSLDFITNDPSDPGELRAYDSSNVLLASATSSGTGGAGTVTTLSITRSTRDIAYITAGNPSGAQGELLALDNLQFENSVPEPASVAIWGLGAVGIAIGTMRRRLRKRLV